MATELKDTLNLPKTDFPMRASLVQREPERLRHWMEQDLYGKIQAKNEGAPRFILHDGPPFTNGDLHLGHALNKTLKDTVLRYKWMRGVNAPYIPGWDSHGLPIEHKVSRELQEKGKTDYTPLEVRRACAEFADKYRRIQSEQFQRLGVLADWANEYWTIHPQYEATEVETFATFVEQGLVYRSKKPVYWSIPCATALAEAEIEYRNHQSVSIYVKLPLALDVASTLGLEEDAAILIWTTTAWTLPANLAVALHPNVEYSTIRTEKGTFILASELIESVTADCGFQETTVIKTFPGKTLEGMEARHPFIDRPSPVLNADFVTTESGTGCVHIAPGHGIDDYMIGMKNGLEVYCPLDDEGRYIEDGRIPAELVGLSVLEEEGKLSPANRGVLKIIADNGTLIGKRKIEHAYPHCWRSKTPVVFRAMDQWFVALDKTGARQRALQALDSVNFIPAWGAKRMRAAIENRPDWCISRQRSWGVPLPAFFSEDNRAYIDAGVIRAIAAKIGEQGTDFWFGKTASEILEGIELPPDWPPPEELTPGADTLDVWIDSGCSHRAVLKVRDNLQWPADLYLEGSDQHRGWFQSSLWTSIIGDNAAPYKAILTHGFIVKEDGTKLAKSDGAAKPLFEWIQDYGADIIRLWICSQDYRGDIPVSDKIVGNIANNYRTIRNTLRWQLGTLYDFDPDSNAISLPDLDILDQWALTRCGNLISEVTRAFDRYEFHNGYQSIINFITVTLSATYHDILKDRLYTLAPDHVQRRSSQTAIRLIFQALVRLLAPLCPFTTDEAWAYFRKNREPADDFVALQDWPVSSKEWDFSGTEADISSLFRFRHDSLNEKIETLRQEKKIGKEVDAVVFLRVSEDHELHQLLNRYKTHLAELFQVSEVRLDSSPPASTAHGPQSIDVSVVPAAELNYKKCPRSWRWVPELVDTPWGAVSPRDAEALNAKN